MPTSAAGSNTAPRRAPHGSGFTLLELLVVIAIIAFATAGVGLAMRDSGQATLDREAERLTALFESARAQSRASGSSVQWRPTPEGPVPFVFDGLTSNNLPNGWLSDGPIVAQVYDAYGAASIALRLGPDPIIAAQQVLLVMPGTPERSIRIGTDGLRPFRIVSP